jgi:hypothetical protein
MIRFACQMCGKRFDRPDESAGTMIFCTCGAANRVPWESDPRLPPPVAEEVPMAQPIPLALPLGEEEVPYQPRRHPGDYVVQRRDAAYCFNHQDIPVQQTCAACRESFCDGCVVVLQGETLCGPCKNFRIRSLHRPARVAALAIIAPIIALVAGPVTLFVLFACAGSHASPAAVHLVSLFGLAVQALALIFAITSLYRLENDPKVGGRGLAITGLVSSLVLVILTVEVAWMVLRLVD